MFLQNLWEDSASLSGGAAPLLPERGGRAWGKLPDAAGGASGRTASGGALNVYKKAARGGIKVLFLRGFGGNNVKLKSYGLWPIWIITKYWG